MATLSFIVSEIADHASDLAGTDIDITEDEFNALGALIALLDQRNSDFLPLHKLLSDTNKALLDPS